MFVAKSFDNEMGVIQIICDTFMAIFFNDPPTPVSLVIWIIDYCSLLSLLSRSPSEYLNISFLLI